MSWETKAIIAKQEKKMRHILMFFIVSVASLRLGIWLGWFGNSGHPSPEMLVTATGIVAILHALKELNERKK